MFNREPSLEQTIISQLKVLVKLNRTDCERAIYSICMNKGYLFENSVKIAKMYTDRIKYKG